MMGDREFFDLNPVRIQSDAAALRTHRRLAQMIAKETGSTVEADDQPAVRAAE